MPCLVTAIALSAPRLALFLVAVFSGFIGRAYENDLWPILGFFFMPLTTLAYAGAINYGGQVTGGWAAIVLVAALADLGVIGGGSRATRKRKKRQRKEKRRRRD